jgi:hypothetical protein
VQFKLKSTRTLRTKIKTCLRTTSRRLPDSELTMSSCKQLFMVIRLRSRKKLRGGRESSMNLRDSTKKLIITMTKIKHFGMVNSSSWSNRETQPSVTLRMLNASSNQQLNHYKNHRMRIRISVSHLTHQ